MDVVQKLWGFCNTLRHDGINYGDYIEQLTYLLFLKLAEEKGLPLPEGYGWPDLRSRSGTDLLSAILRRWASSASRRGCSAISLPARSRVSASQST